MESIPIQDKARVVALLAEGYCLWSQSPLPELPYSERYIAADEATRVYRGKNAAELAAACQSFYLFRKLHSMAGDYPEWATLLGDYFFSQFSKNLIPLDSVPLTDSFAAYLSADTQSALCLEEYLEFIGGLPEVINQ